MLRFLLSLLPGRLHSAILRARGHQIGAGAQIGFGSILQVDQIELGAGAKVGPFVHVRAERLVLDSKATIKPLTTLSAGHIHLGHSARIGMLNIASSDVTLKSNRLVLGAHAQTFPFCWLDPGHGITLGERTGLGGHGLVFTHGSWSNYFRGAPVAFGPVNIGARVWIPWRVFILPGVTIGDDAIIAGGSVITKDVPAGSLAGGSPAKVIREKANAFIDEDELRKRLDFVLSAIMTQPWATRRLVQTSHTGPSLTQVPADVYFGANLSAHERATLSGRGATVVDVVSEKAWLGTDSAAGLRVISWLTRYGVRCDVQEGSAE
ncbi:acyltransferase [Ornithinimicrobium cryptoxanthini]|uniref:acyltransferase n=1 Tax=Ornithinimicrobium cryptoxanthini TaxID=2934161 RepID=UPI002473085A|nr:hypothetical protein [Ornithinimicrobium cryptoxanthini]